MNCQIIAWNNLGFLEQGAVDGVDDVISAGFWVFLITKIDL
jgi:hypothetical protein